jgi:hypothetical protein
MSYRTKIVAAALLAAAVTSPVATRAGILQLAGDAVLAERQAHGITLDSVGKEVSPGVFQVDPRAVTGRRIVFSPTASPPQLICFGSWNGSICKGILVDLRAQNAPAALPVPAVVPAPAPAAAPATTSPPPQSS